MNFPFIKQFLLDGDIMCRSYKVQYLDLSMATISSHGLEELLSNCYSLRRLSLENCELNNNICRQVYVLFIALSQFKYTY